MKSILLSIKPKWCAKIMNGVKTIEVRKNTPKCDLPIDVYIYCTKENDLGRINDFPNKYFVDCVETPQDFKKMDSAYNGKGKVVAKFTLNKVDKYVNGCNVAKKYPTFNDFEKILTPACIYTDELENYCEDLSFYAWHISNLVIFDEPKYLCDFWNTKKGVFCCPLTKAPQNYCYIETGN